MTGDNTTCAGCGIPMRSCVFPALCSQCRQKEEERKQEKRREDKPFIVDRRELS